MYGSLESPGERPMTDQIDPFALGAIDRDLRDLEKAGVGRAIG